MKTLEELDVAKQAAHHVELLVDGQHTAASISLRRTCSVLLKGELALDRTLGALHRVKMCRGRPRT